MFFDPEFKIDWVVVLGWAGALLFSALAWWGVYKLVILSENIIYFLVQK